MLAVSRRILFLFCCLVVLIGSAGAEQQPRIRLATLAPRGTSFDRLLKTMGEEWSKAPDGGVSLVVYTDGTMGSEQEIVRRMRVGQLQAGLLTTDGLAMIDPTVKALEQIPLMYHSAAELDYVRSRMQGSIEKRMEDRGFVVLAWSMVGFARVFSKQPGLHPQEFLRMKLYVGSDDAREVEVLSSVGGHPVGLDWTNALTGLQTGMVDCITTIPVHALAAQFNTAVSNMLDLKWVPVSGGLIVTKKSWDALPENMRAVMKQEAQDAAAKMEAASYAEDADAVAAMQKRGMKIYPMSPKLEAEWDQFAHDALWPKIRGSIIDAESFDEAQRLTLEYRKQAGGLK
jgi:TRAP-type C4-dicarboxylate transport system substrate-binding protein